VSGRLLVTLVIVATAMDLVLCAIDAGSGRARFGPRLSYALPVAELCDLVLAGCVTLDGDYLAVQPRQAGDPVAGAALSALARCEPVTVPGWVKIRGPYGIDRYLRAAADAGVVRIVPQDGRKVLKVADAGPLHQAADRLVTVLDDPAPGFSDAAFVMLADLTRVARPQLRGWGNRKRRARLAALRRALSSTAGRDDDANAVLRAGLDAVVRMSRLAGADPRSIDKQIGLTDSGRAGAIYTGGGV